eukprot:394112-Amphidinium_carterae.2
MSFVGGNLGQSRRGTAANWFLASTYSGVITLRLGLGPGGFGPDLGMRSLEKDVFTPLLAA